jgi:hypothetical protein
LQKKQNKVAKSAWKFLKTNKKEIYLYIEEFKLIEEDQGYKSFGFVKNNLLINNINHTFRYKFHIGNYYTIKKFSKYCVGLKGGEFLKFTKPFSYVSKKKKKNKC